MRRKIFLKKLESHKKLESVEFKKGVYVVALKYPYSYQGQVVIRCFSQQEVMEKLNDLESVKDAWQEADGKTRNVFDKLFGVWRWEFWRKKKIDI